MDIRRGEKPRPPKTIIKLPDALRGAWQRKTTKR
jgi:hypothetical protein